MWPEALPSFIIIGGCFVFTGTALMLVERWNNGGKVRHLSSQLDVVISNLYIYIYICIHSFQIFCLISESYFSISVCSLRDMV